MVEVLESTEQASAVNDKFFYAKPGELNLYFAYGSNMNREQIRSRCGKMPAEVGIAKLPNHRIGFYGYSKTWDGGSETAVPSPDSDLWGVIYKLSYFDGDSLDVWQDARLDGTGAYFHFPTRVTDVEGKLHTVVLYKKDILGTPQKPSQEYLDFIIQGASEHGLPSTYMDSLRSIETKKAEFEVPVRSKFNRGLLVGMDCSQCGDAPAPKTTAASK